jgi:hypothetical protein
MSRRPDAESYGHSWCAALKQTSVNDGSRPNSGIRAGHQNCTLQRVEIVKRLDIAHVISAKLIGKQTGIPS